MSAEPVWGCLGSCTVCGRSSGWWLAHGDRYRCVHPNIRCLDQLTETLDELDRVAALAARPAGPARGAWARLRKDVPVTARRTLAEDSLRHGLGHGSPFFRPGMEEGAPWVVVAETNLGHLIVPGGASGDHVRKVNAHWRLLSGQGREVAMGGARAVAGCVVDPAGVLLDCWGEGVVTPGSPRWVPITRVTSWLRCSACSEPLWPGCLVSTPGGRCVTCVARDEADDPREWPDEPRDPGMLLRPEHLGGPKRRKVASTRHETS